MGHRKRTSFLSAISFAQVSEFSLIMVFTGSRLNHISNDILSTVTAVGALTFVLSTYFMVYSDKLYRIFSPMLDF
ncbi:MAG: sodium:proton exchanger, partial [Candidatus Levybacteria bacterium]|nr:sodium:proton exchanger [Candidatus Levybacteria bacterium]